MESIELKQFSEPLVLSSGKCAYLPRHNALLLADLHLGKDTTFRQAGIPVPLGATSRTLEKWSQILRIYNPSDCYVLGDLIHARSSLIDTMFDMLSKWLALQSETRFHLILGNHDHRSQRRLRSLPLHTVCDHLDLGIWRLIHDPDSNVQAESSPSHQCTIAGHLHPSYRVRLNRQTFARAPCFVVRPTGIVLPAFGEFTGTAGLELTNDAHAYLVCDDELIPARSCGLSNAIE